MLQIFCHTSERYLHFCNEKKFVLSDFVRKAFIKEKSRIEKNPQSAEFIYLKLCGNNKDLTKERLTDAHIKGLCTVLEEDVSVKSLDLRYNRITDRGADYIANLLKRNRTIVELNLMGNDIGVFGSRLLGDALISNSTLKVLKMTGNKIGDHGGMEFAAALQINDSLEEIDLGECDLEITSIIAFATLLECNTALKAVNLDRPLIRSVMEETCDHMEQMLCLNKTLKELHLAKYEIRDSGVLHLCDALIINRSLTILDLSCNRITRDGAKLIAKVLRHNTPLKVLDLGYNRIHDQGIIDISNALKYCNTNLKCLIITHNEIEDEGLHAILMTLEVNKTLESLYLWGNKFTSKFIKILWNLLDTVRLIEPRTDIRPYVVDNVYYAALLTHNIDYRRYRFTAPVNGSDVPNNRSYSIF